MIDLPAELFEFVIGHYVHTAPMHEVFKARSVCRAFRKQIEHVMLSEVTVDAYKDYQDEAIPKFNDFVEGPMMFLERHKTTLLTNHCISNRGIIHPKVPTFVNRTVDILMRFTDITQEAKLIATHETYLGDVCKAVSAANGLHYLSGYSSLRRDGWRERGTGPINTVTQEEWYTEEDRKWIRENPGVTDVPIGFTTKDMMSAAAAVGNNEAVDYYQARGAKLIDPGPRRAREKRVSRLGEPVKAAAINGQTAMIRRIVELARREYPDADDWQQGFMRGTFSGALGHAIDVGDAVSTLLLFEFQCAHNFDQIFQIWFFMVAQKNDRRRDVKLLASLVKDSHSFLSAKDYKLTIEKIVDTAFHQGRVEVVQQILNDNVVIPEREEMCQKFLMKAAVNGHVAFLDVIRTHGARLGSEHLAEAMVQPVVARPCFHMVQHLIDAGVTIDTEVLKKCEIRASLLLKGRHERDKQAYMMDGTMTVIFISSQAMQHVTPRELKRWGSIKLFIRLVLNGKMKVQAGPLPFFDMTQQVADWMAAGQ